MANNALAPNIDNVLSDYVYAGRKLKEQRTNNMLNPQVQAALNYLKSVGSKFTSLDTPQDMSLGETAADIGLGFVPGIGTAQGARDFERARRENDYLGMGLSAASMLPVVGGVVKTGKKVVTKIPKIEKIHELFNQFEKLPTTESVDAIRSDWIGGVSGIGNRDLMYQLPNVEGGLEHTKQVQSLAKNTLGDSFKGYRLLSNDELEEIMSGAMGSHLASFSLDPNIPKAFKNLPSYQKRNDLHIIEMDLTPEHIKSIGHTGEKELVVDYGVGYNPDNIKIIK